MVLCIKLLSPKHCHWSIVCFCLRFFLTWLIPNIVCLFGWYFICCLIISICLSYVILLLILLNIFLANVMVFLDVFLFSFLLFCFRQLVSYEMQRLLFEGENQQNPWYYYAEKDKVVCITIDTILCTCCDPICVLKYRSFVRVLFLSFFQFFSIFFSVCFAWHVALH